MKIKLFFIIINALIFTNTKAQTEKGHWLVGGAASYYKYKITQNVFQVYIGEYSKISAMPKVGYFWTNKIVSGFVFDFSKSKGSYDNNTSEYNSKFLSGGIFSRLYFTKLEQPLQIFSEAEFQLGAQSQLKEWVSNYSIISVATGVEYFFNTSCAIEISAAFKSVMDKNKGINNAYPIGTNKEQGVMLKFGFQLHLIN
jgi:hypothetical protein